MKPTQYILIGHIPFTPELCQFFNLDTRNLSKKTVQISSGERRSKSEISNYKNPLAKGRVIGVDYGQNKERGITKLEEDLLLPDGTWRTVKNCVLPVTLKSIQEK